MPSGSKCERVQWVSGVSITLFVRVACCSAQRNLPHLVLFTDLGGVGAIGDLALAACC